MGIAEKLTTLNQIKADIKSALESKGLSPTDDFTTYANMVENVPDYKSVLNKTATNLTLDSSVPTLYNYSISGYNDITVNCPETIKIEPLAFSGSNKVTLVRGSNQQVIESGQLVITKDVEINNDDYHHTESVVLKGEVASTFGVPDGATFIKSYGRGYTYEAENSEIYRLDFSAAHTAGLYVLKITSEYNTQAFPINESSTATGTILFYFESNGYQEMPNDIMLKDIAYSSLAKDIIFDNMLDSSTKVYLNGSEISNTVEYLNYGWNEISCYNLNYAPYYINRYIQNGDTLFITTPNDPGISMQLIPSTTDNSYQMAYELTSFNTDTVHILPGTSVAFNVQKQGYRWVKNSYTPSQSCKLSIPMQEEVLENVNLSGTFDSSGYSQNYMANATTNGFTISNGALFCNPQNEDGSFVEKDGYIEFISPSETATLSIDCLVSSSGSATSGSGAWSSAAVYLFENELKKPNWDSDDNKYEDNTILFAQSSIDRKVYTATLKPFTKYFLVFGTGHYSSSATAKRYGLYIYSVQFNSSLPYSNTITITDLEGNNIGEITE